MKNTAIKNSNMGNTKLLIKVLLFAMGAIILFAAASCDKLDVVGNDSKKSFKAVLEVMQKNISNDETTGSWKLLAPDNEAEFLWPSAYNTNNIYDIMLVINAQPFIAAGLIPEKLPANEYHFSSGKIIVGTKFNNEKNIYNDKPNPITSYERLVELHRNVIGYHAALDHYGVTIGNGNLFEWAKEMSNNDKDIVFVLNPQPFIDAGTDPNAVKGWLFTKVTVDDINGKPVEVDKILKAFNIK